MKKRSLLAAVAMLIVSAIVLTSATYAWFATNTTVSVEEVQASVSNTDGSILISEDGLTWRTSLTKDQLAGVAGNSFATNFTPISVDPESMSIVGGSISAGMFNPADVTTGTYIKYTVHIKSDSDVTVNINPSFNFGTAFIYGLVKTPTQTTIRNNNEISKSKYYPVIANSGDPIADANGNSILDDAEHDANTANGFGTPGVYDTVRENVLGNLVTCDTNALSLSLVKGVPQQITVMLWAEGQNIACSGTVASASSGVTLAITKAA